MRARIIKPSDVPQMAFIRRATTSEKASMY